MADLRFFCSLKHGEEKAKLYYVANTEGMKLIKDWVEEHSIECNLTAMQWIPLFTQILMNINVKSQKN